jgi:hypothetical protein
MGGRARTSELREMAPHRTDSVSVPLGRPAGPVCEKTPQPPSTV